MKKHPYTMSRKAILVAISAAFVSPTSFAQDAGKKALEDKKIQKVEIAATVDKENNSAKTSAALRDIPISISLVPSEVIQEQAALNLDAVVKNVSGLTPSSTNNYGYFNNYLARGLQVNFVRDGLADGPAVNGYARTLTDVQQVEVLKGPGSAMYGAGTPGGFVNLITKKPESVAAQNVEAGLGSFNSVHFKWDATGAMSESANYRFITAWTKSDGYRGFGNHTMEVLPSFRFDIDRRQHINVNLRHMDSRIDNDSVGMVFRQHAILDVPQSTRFYTPFTESTTLLDQINVKHVIQLSEAWAVRSDFSYGKRDLDFKRNVPNWRVSDTATGTQMINRNWRDQEDRLHDSVVQVEAVWEGEAGGVKHEFLMGAAWNQTQGTAMRKQALLAPIMNVYAPVFPEKSNQEIDRVLMWDRDVKAAQTGWYLQDQISLSPEWKLRLGLRTDRYTIEDKGQYNTLFDAGGAFRSTLASNQQSFQAKPAVLRYEEAQITSSKPSVSLGAVYHASPNRSYYVGAATGSFSNFTTEMGRTAFVPETSRQFEIGSKSTYFNGLVSSNIAIYDNRRFDYFQTATGLTGSLGSAKTQGMDMEVSARPLSGWQLRLAYAYQDAVYTRYMNIVTKQDDLSIVGNRVAGTSQHQVNVWSTYDFQSAQWKGFGIGGGFSYRDAFYVDTFNKNLAPGKPIVDLLAYYRGQDFEVQANLGNTADVRWYRHGAGENSAVPGNPRTLNITARFKF